MDGLKKAQPEMIKSFLPVFSKLSYSGLFFYDENTRWWKSKYSGFVVLSIYSIFMCFHFCGAIQKLHEVKGLSKISVELGGCMVFVEGITMLIHLMWSRQSIINYILKLDEAWQNNISLLPEQIEDKKKIIQKFDKGMTRYFSALRISTIWYISAPVLWNVCTAVRSGHFERETSFYLELGFDYRSNLAVFLSVFAFDGIALYCVCWIVGAPLWLITVAIRNLYVMFVCFHHDIRNIINKPDLSTMKTDMRTLLSRHTSLLQLQDEIGRPFGAIFVLHVGYFIIVIGFYAITAMLEKDVSALKDVLICAIGFINILPICYFGQLLTDSSEEVSTAAYDTAWYNIDVKYQKNILLMMYRAQKAKYITSTFITNISLITYTKVMKSTWSFLSLILTMMER